MYDFIQFFLGFFRFGFLSQKFVATLSALRTRRAAAAAAAAGSLGDSVSRVSLA